MKKQIILLIICGLIIFVIGGGAGIYYQIQKDAPQLEKSNAATTAIESLSSGFIPAINAQAQVKKISGRRITLSSTGGIAEISVPENAKIISFTKPAATTTQKPTMFVQGEAAFGDIKVGDNLNVSLKILSDGKMEITSIIIMPVEEQPATGTEK